MGYFLAVDSSSTCSGVVLFKDKTPVSIQHHVSDKKKPLNERLLAFGKFLQSVKAKNKLECVIYELDSVRQNMNTIRMLSYFEGVCLYKAAEWNTPAKFYRPSTARKLGLGNGSLSKQDAYDIIIKTYPVKNDDESDAIVLGKAYLNDRA